MVLQLTSPQPPRRNGSSLAQLTSRVLHHVAHPTVGNIPCGFGEINNLLLSLSLTTAQYCMKKRSKDRISFLFFNVSGSKPERHTLPYIQFTFSYRFANLEVFRKGHIFFKEILLIYSNKTKKYERKTNKMHIFGNNLFHLDFPLHVSNK